MAHELGRTRGLVFARTGTRFESWVLRSATLVCAVSGVLAEMLEELGVARERLLVTPNGVHFELYQHADRAAARRAARVELGLASQGLVLGFVGYYRDWHRLDLVIEALPSLPGAELVLVGEGPARADLERRAQEVGVASRVHFAAPRAHARIPGILPAFDVALLPAINAYASPLKLFEYMASGLPVVAPDQANLREVLVDRENGLLVAPGDGAALLAALKELASDRSLRERLGAAARGTIVERDLTWRGNARRVIAAVEGLKR
jgi:glycosyltransferase involved in cell wall biosynthesis